jgi:peptide chain release factor subunit 3
LKDYCSFVILTCEQCGESVTRNSDHKCTQQVKVETPNQKEITIIDGPDYKTLMEQNKGLLSFGAFVISARKNDLKHELWKDSVMREQLREADSLGVQKWVVIINKMDHSSISWDKQSLNEIKKEVSKFLKSLGFKIPNIYWVPVSAHHGVNLKDRKEMKQVCPWYDGPCLLEAIDQMIADRMSRV